MKLLIVLSLVAVAATAPQQQQRSERQAGGVVQILKFDSDNDGLGNYRYDYEQSDGRKQSEQGELRNGGTDNAFVAVRGSYSWVGPDGVTYIVKYVADENGYQPNLEQGPGGAFPPALIASLNGAG